MPSKTDKIAFEHKGIGDVLAHNRLMVPPNQREYSWESEHVEDLFRDFAHAIAENKESYFLGTIVLTSGDEDIPEVSDGQQRLATTTILLAAIRDYFFRKNDLDRARSIENEFLWKTDRKTTEIVPRLRLNVDDNEFFTKFILTSPNLPDRKIEPTKESHRRIANAAQIAENHVRNILEPHSEANKTAQLLHWVDFIEKEAQVIMLLVPDYLNAFVMFETLNDRGLRASQADLLKNHLLSYAKDRIGEAQHKWAKMVGILESLGQGDITVTYLHHLLITKFGPLREREVFDRVKEFVNSQGKALEFLEELADSANDYAALFNPNLAKWNEYGTSTRKHISTINRDLRVEQIRPLMFAVSRHFSIKEAKIAFQLFVFWSVRFLIVHGRGGVLERRYALRAQEIATKTITTARELAANMSDIVPTDALFETAFAEARVSQIHVARYYLRALESKVKGNLEPEYVIEDDEQVINLEHILPEHPDTFWPSIDQETASAYHRRIGNMVLLQARQNSKLGNTDFSSKKAIYEKSPYLLTAEVAKYDSWGAEQIKERQKGLAQLAVKTWPI